MSRIFLLFLGSFFLFSKVFLQTPSALGSLAPIGMVLVPVGPYIAGSDKYNDERPSREIHLDAFFVDRFEVTQKQFKKIMNINPSEFRGENLPVDRVNWYQARDYCNKIGKRLPTEAEWEKSARSGSTAQYYWGDKPDNSHAWHWDNSGRKTHPVGEKKPNKFGLAANSSIIPIELGLPNGLAESDFCPSNKGKTGTGMGSMAAPTTCSRPLGLSKLIYAGQSSVTFTVEMIKSRDPDIFLRETESDELTK